VKIYLDSGHGINNSGVYDSGAVGPNGVREEQVNFTICGLIKEYLTTAGVEVVYNQVESNTQAVNHANASGADLYIAVHCNSAEDPKAHGTEVWYGGSVASLGLATCIQRQVVETLRTAGRGVKKGNWQVTRDTHMPAVLVEIAFVSNPVEEKILNTYYQQVEIARAIARGVTDYIMTL